MALEDVIKAAYAPFEALVGAEIAGDGAPLIIKSVSRKLIHWSKVEAVNQPCMFFTQGTQIVAKNPGLPNKRTISIKLWLYTYVEEDCGPQSYANNFLDLVTAKFKPSSLDGSGKNRLLQLVEGKPAVALAEDFRWNGSVSTDEGWLSAQSVQVIPLEIINANL